MGAGLHLGIPGAASGGRGPPPNPSLTISHLGACAGPGPGLCCGLGAGSIMVLWESLDWERDGLDVSHTRPFSWFSFFFSWFSFDGAMCGVFSSQSQDQTCAPCSGPLES